MWLCFVVFAPKNADGMVFSNPACRSWYAVPQERNTGGLRAKCPRQPSTPPPSTLIKIHINRQMIAVPAEISRTAVSTRRGFSVLFIVVKKIVCT